MYSSYTVEVFTHTLAHETGVAKYEPKTLTTNSGYEAAMHQVYYYMGNRRQWDNDGFTKYVRFRVLNNDTKEYAIIQYNYYDSLRTFASPEISYHSPTTPSN